MSEGSDQDIIDSQSSEGAVGQEVEKAAETSQYNLSFKDILCYLLGNRKAIIKVARNSSSIWYGILFVFFAGIAREYDQELFSENPMVYFIPFIASTIMILWIVLWFQINTRTLKLLIGNSQLRSFFATFWMTGPLAFLYAIPVEEFFDSMLAVEINLSLLSLVAIWRVFLYGRVLHVCTGVNFYAPLITACCVVAYPSLMLKYVSIVGVMSGSALSAEQELLRNFTGAAMGVVVIAFFISLPVTLFQFVTYKKNPERLARMPEIDQKGRVSLVFILSASLLAALAYLSFQGKLSNHSRFTALVQEDKYEEALAFAKDLNRDDFVKTRPLALPYSSNEGIYLLALLNEEHPQWLKDVVYKWAAVSFQSRWSDDESLVKFLNKKPLLNSDLEFLRNNKEIFNEHVNNVLLYTTAKSYDQKMKIVLFDAVQNFSQYDIISEKNLEYLQSLQSQ
ncbi:hypothetical protein PQO01_20520 [Lentisphaera marina]|uniref:hypothetical protein n=1 Tax=Lentisphaera marina TaxID=1111041 RepID=UPI0023660B1A|nr:hypothetical protein [Lentisphaera marina]MDD7987344.1 hypothetical protein [Lentisphaera marina]